MVEVVVGLGVGRCSHVQEKLDEPVMEEEAR